MSIDFHTDLYFMMVVIDLIDVVRILAYFSDVALWITKVGDLCSSYIRDIWVFDIVVICITKAMDVWVIDGDVVCVVTGVGGRIAGEACIGVV